MNYQKNREHLARKGNRIKRINKYFGNNKNENIAMNLIGQFFLLIPFYFCLFTFTFLL